MAEENRKTKTTLSLHKTEMKEDMRYLVAKTRLSRLTYAERQRIIDNIDIICLDTYNYHEGKFCPLSVAMNLHLTMKYPTDKKVKSELGKRFSPINIFKGIKGDFYTTNRKEDLLNLCKELNTL